MANDADKKSNFITRALSLAKQTKELHGELEELIKESDNLFKPGKKYPLVDGDFVGDNDHLTATDFQDGMIALSNVRDVFTAGNDKNLTDITVLLR